MILFLNFLNRRLFFIQGGEILIHSESSSKTDKESREYIENEEKRVLVVVVCCGLLAWQESSVSLVDLAFFWFVSDWCDAMA